MEEAVETKENMGSNNDTGKGGKKRDPEKQMATKKRFAAMPGSIVFISAGSSGFEFYRLLLNLNRYIRRINNSAVFGDILEIKAKHEGITKLCNDVWDNLKDIAPRFHAFDQKRWLDINETIDEKLRLINRRASCVINPVDDNVAMLAMAVKILSEKFNEGQAKADFGSLEKIALLFRKIKTDLIEIMGEDGGKGRGHAEGDSPGK